MSDTTLDTAAQVLWRYLCMDHQPEKVDCIVGMGSYDIRVAQHCAELFLQEYAPVIIFTGGRGRLTPAEWITEADAYAEKAMHMGVPAENIVIENKSTNTGENVRFTREILKERGISVQKVLFVHKPYMERRTYATFKKEWPELEVIASSPQIPFEDYPTDMIPKHEMIDVMVGELQRIKDYPAKGFQIEQEIPTEVWEAFTTLVALGYKKYLV